MKLIIKYFDVWGRPIQIAINITSRGKVKDLKRILSQQTDIPIKNQEVSMVVGEVQYQLVDDENYLSDYPFSDKAIVYVGTNSDEFSLDFQSMSEQSSVLMPPDISIDTISVRESMNQNLTDDIFHMYSEKDFQVNVMNIIELAKLDDMESIKSLYQNHKYKMQQLMEDNKEQEPKMDILNDLQTTGWSFVHFTVFCGNSRFLMWAISEGGDITIPTKDDWDCLTLAVWQCHYELLTLLMAQPNININRLSKRGTALHIAAQLDDPQSTKILLKHPKINLYVLNQKKQRPIDVAGCRTAPLLHDDKSIVIRESQVKLLSFYNFMVNLPQRPPIVQGDVMKVNYFKVCHYRRYMVLDPESGVLARFKNEQDAPYHPNHIIALETINDVRISRQHWFQSDKYIYIEINYLNEHIFLSFKSKAAARQWYEALRNSVGYVKYLNGKFEGYMANDARKAQKNIVQVMMQRSNQVIVIEDDVQQIDQKAHIKQLVEEKRQKYKNNLLSVSEHSVGEESGQQFQQDISTDRPEVDGNRAMKLSDFEIQEYIGRGAFGNVYKAKCKMNGRLYALKQQEKEKMIHTNQLKYVIREISILKQLHNPFLVHLHFAFQTSQYLYLALDYCGRGDLSRYMTRGVILDEQTSKFLIAEIILAIEYLHEKNIIYRDLKPENIIIDDDGFIKLIDFGLSREGDSEEFIAKSFCGSPAYLSPELISGSGSTKATDIYSIGTILYEMLTGYPPFYCDNLKNLLNNIRFSKLVIPTTISKGAQNLLSKMLEKNPDCRVGGRNIQVLKKHIFFAEINWEKLQMKKLIPPSLNPRVFLQSRTGKEPINQIIIDQNDQSISNFISGWNYGF